jgi:hypothetical protein
MTLLETATVESITQGIDFGVLTVGFVGEADSINSRRASRKSNRRNNLRNRHGRESRVRSEKLALIRNGARQPN